MNLTPEEIERYQPYHTMREFEQGFDVDLGDGVGAQAYDRGAECAMWRGRVVR
jgi:hypothetical protein